jgi:hypothetical protein
MVHNPIVSAFAASYGEQTIAWKAVYDRGKRLVGVNNPKSSLGVCLGPASAYGVSV